MNGDADLAARGGDRSTTVTLVDAVDHRLLHPYPGLRPFVADEGHLFFGRDEQCDALLERLDRARLVAVVGASGSGKSSLVRAGLIPALQRGYLTSGEREWRIAIIGHPGIGPLDALARALFVTARAVPRTTGVTEASLRQLLGLSSAGLEEAARFIIDASSENLLLVVDQFEELFRFARAPDRSTTEESAAFVRLLLAAAQQDSTPVYVVLTMRSDFIGHCPRFLGLPEAMNDSQFLVPRLTREQLKQAIEGPAAVAKGSIAPRLVQRLLNDAQDDPDQLPVLQHALMRMWNIAAADRAAGAAVDVSHYDDPRVGGLAQALHVHAEEVFHGLTARQQELARPIFQALTGREPDLRDVRRPSRLADLAAVTGTSVDEVRGVLQAFEGPQRTFVRFIVPPGAGGDSPETIADITHESLIWLWQRLRGWVNDEAASAEIYGDLVKASRRWSGEGGQPRSRYRAGSLYRGPELARASAWWRDTQPTAAWAARYGGQHETVSSFLNRSERSQRWLRIGVTGTVIVLALLAAGLGYFWYRAASSAREAAELAKRAHELSEESLARSLSAQVRLLDRGSSTPSLTGALLAVEGLSRSPLPETEDLVRQLLVAPEIAGGSIRPYLDPEGDFATPVVSDTAIALLTSDRWLRVLDLATGLPIVEMAPEVLFPNAGQVLIRHLRFSPDGSKLAAAVGRRIAILNIDDRKTRATYQLAEGVTLENLEFDPRGRVIAAQAGDSVVLIAVADGTPAVAPIGNRPKAHTFSPDGRWLAITTDTSIVVVDAATAARTVTIGGLGPDPSSRPSVRFSPNSRLIAVSLGRVVRAHDLELGRALALPPAAQGHAIGFASDNRTLVIQDARGAKLIDVETGAPREMPVDDDILQMKMPPGGEHLVTLALGTGGAKVEPPSSPGVPGWSFRISLINLPGEEQRWSSIGWARADGAYPRGRPLDGQVAFSRDGRTLAVLVRDHLTFTTQIVSLENGRVLNRIGFEERDRYPRRTTEMLPSADGKWWLVLTRHPQMEDDGEVKVLGIDGTRLPPEAGFQSGDVAAMDGSRGVLWTGSLNGVRYTIVKPAAMPIGRAPLDDSSAVQLITGDRPRLVALDADASIRIVDPSGVVKRTVQIADVGQSRDYPRIFVNRTGTRAVIGWGGGPLSLVDLTSDSEPITVPGIRLETGTTLSADGALLVVPGRRQGAVLVDAITGQTQGTVEFDGPIRVTAISADSRRIAVAGPSNLRVFDRESGKDLLATPIRETRRLAFNHDGSTLAVAAGNGVTIRSFNQSAPPVAAWEGLGQATFLRFSPDGGRLFVATTSGVIHMLPAAGGAGRQAMVPDLGVVALSDDARLLAAAGSGVVRVFDTATATERHRWTFSGMVEGVGFSGDDLVVAATDKGTVTMWRQTLLPDRLRAAACERLVRNLTSDEWRQYLGNVPYRATCPNLPVPGAK